VSLTLVSGSPDATRAVGAALAEELRAGDVVVLAGELGAGKTCLVQGLAAALGHTDRVTSPTFLLARRLDTTPPVVHADAWRLDRVGDLLDLGDELLDEDVVTVLEWGDAVAEVLPGDRVEVDLVLDGDLSAAAPGGDPDAPRRLTVTGRGTWAARVERCADQLRRAVEET
jgi:tRNA threonylcarbamoyladenosine biosynthesis protein TsaE